EGGRGEPGGGGGGGAGAGAAGAGLPLFALPRDTAAPAAAHAIDQALTSGGAAAAMQALRAGAALARAAREGGVADVVAALAAATGLGVVLQADDGRRLAAAGRADGRPIAARRGAGRAGAPAR